jgi:hypothetical protein
LDHRECDDRPHPDSVKPQSLPDVFRQLHKTDDEFGELVDTLSAMVDRRMQSRSIIFKLLPWLRYRQMNLVMKLMNHRLGYLETIRDTTRATDREIQEANNLYWQGYVIALLRAKRSDLISEKPEAEKAAFILEAERILGTTPPPVN